LFVAKNNPAVSLNYKRKWVSIWSMCHTSCRGKSTKNRQICLINYYFWIQN